MRFVIPATFLVALAMAALPLAEGSHPPLLGFFARDGIALDAEGTPWVAHLDAISFCDGVALVKLSLKGPGGSMTDTFRANVTIDSVGILDRGNRCLGYVPEPTRVHLWNETIGVDWTGQVQGAHLVITVALAGTYRGGTIAFAGAAL